MTAAESTHDTALPTAASRISWAPPCDGFLRVSLLNGLLRILTLGLYHFWGKTEVRRRIWSAVRIDGEPLEYRGTGGELLRGFLIVFGLVLIPLGLTSFAVTLFLGRSGTMRGSYELAAWALLLLLSGFGIHRARRYRLSRTRWRGIRAGLSGRSTPFAWTYLWTVALVPLTLGWILPWRMVRLQQALMNETRFGDKPFMFTGRAGPLYKRFWLVWVSGVVLFFLAMGAVGAIVGYAAIGAGRPRPVLSNSQVASIIAVIFGTLLVFAMIRAWYSTRVLNYFAAQTTFQGAPFTLEATVPSLVWLTATNYLMRVLSLGFLSAVTEARSMRYIVDRLSLAGAVDWGAVGQNADALLASGEGLAEAFNVDAF